MTDTIQLNCEYFPNISWFYLSSKHKKLYWNTSERFIRASGQNRCIVCGPNGIITLSVPLAGGRNQQSMLNDVRIDNRQRWQAIHWKTIQSCYGSTPYFLYYADAIGAIFARRFDRLIDLNQHTTEVILRLLKIPTSIQWTHVNEPSMSGHAMISKPYIQPFMDRHGFVQNLSVLDTLFCCGPSSLTLFD
jgi:WbqC-like protein family.